MTASVQHTGEGLKRVVGVPGLALTVVNSTIGAGIFALPAIISLQLGAFGVFDYIFCAVMMAAIMLCYMETGTRITTSGGSYAYVEAAFGSFPAFIVNWLYFFGWGVLGSAAVINIFADSLSGIFPVLSIPLMRGLLFFVFLGFIVVLNVRGAKESVWFLELITIIKLLPLVALIILGFPQVKAANLHWDRLPSLKSFSDTSLVLFFAFANFELSLNVSGELKDPKHTVPRGIFLGGMIVLIVYLLLQTVTQGVLGSDMTAFKDAPLAAVAEKIVGPIGATVLLITAAISCFGNVSGDILGTPRLLFAGAKDGMFPKLLGRVHPRFAIPHWAVMIYGTLIFIFSVTGGFKQLAILASAAILLIYLAVILASIKLRRIPQDSKEKTFRMPGGPIIPIIGIACIIWLLSGLSKLEIIATLIFLAAICLIYFAMKGIKSKNKRGLSKK
jgi:basic amino acid/polyamine antiporter, APA family